MFCFKRFEVRQDRTAMKVGTDGVLVGAWARIEPTDRRMLDIGTGTGLIALMLAQRTEETGAAPVRITGLDVEELSDAEANAAASPWADRIRFLRCPVQEFRPDDGETAPTGERPGTGPGSPEIRSDDQTSAPDNSEQPERMSGGATPNNSEQPEHVDESAWPDDSGEPEHIAGNAGPDAPEQPKHTPGNTAPDAPEQPKRILGNTAPDAPEQPKHTPESTAPDAPEQPERMPGSVAPDNRFDLIVSNPPFFVDSLTCPDRGRTAARHAVLLPFEALRDAVCRLLAPDGRFAVILPVEEGRRFEELCRGRLVLHRMTRVRTTPRRAPKRLLLEFMHAEAAAPSPLPTCDELVIGTGSHEEYTPEYRTLTRDFYLKF